ncbi:MAG: HAMP domain-containing histidine kinase [Butyrivibrio sp.]|nr:HAMP domain-containing histidine kinase [Butyrivibrio sp.]
MKRHLSLKLRITLWFTFFLVLITSVFLALVISIYRTYSSEEIKKELVEIVEEEAFLLESDEEYLESLVAGEITEVSFLKEDIKLMVYDEDGDQIAGIFLYDELDDKDYLSSDRPKKIEINGILYYYYDAKVKVRHGTDYYVRGIVRAETSITSIVEEHAAIMLLIPILILAAFCGGYLLAGKLLKPIKKIDDTTEEIRQSGDITKRIEFKDNGDELSGLSAHINNMFDTLQKNFEAEKQFTSSASHELRTPVSVILAQCEYAIENAKSKEEILDSISSIQKQGYKMNHLIEALLMFTRMDQGTEKYPKETVNLSDIVNSSYEDFSIIADKNISIITKINTEVVGKVNKELFSLMINNLIQNAIKYGKESGHVYVELQKNAESVKLEIRDDGLGISDEDIPHIFEVFYRADKSRNSKGLGLGLSLVKRIVEFHGGNIKVESIPEKGSCFTVFI